MVKIGANSILTPSNELLFSLVILLTLEEPVISTGNPTCVKNLNIERWTGNLHIMVLK
jgi:hypothetical protein